MTSKTQSQKRTYAENIALAIARGKKNVPVELPSDLIRTVPPTTTPTGQLPMWVDAVRGVPNSVLRSALFGAIKRGKRAYQDGVKKASLDGITVIHTGPQLDQADLDVWEHCLHLARISGLGTRIQFGVGYFLRDIGRSTGGKDWEWIKGAFRRLASSVVEITDGDKAYFGPMLHRGFREDNTGIYIIEINPDIVKLYGTDGWTSIEFQERRALKKQPLAQWLHGFYSTHARPYPFKVETLHKLCGSENSQLAGFRRDLSDALKKLEVATGWTCNINENDLVNVAKTPTASQGRHLLKLATK